MTGYIFSHGPIVQRQTCVYGFAQFWHIAQNCHGEDDDTFYHMQGFPHKFRQLRCVFQRACHPMINTHDSTFVNMYLFRCTLNITLHFKSSIPLTLFYLPPSRVFLGSCHFFITRSPSLTSTSAAPTWTGPSLWRQWPSPASPSTLLRKLWCLRARKPLENMETCRSSGVEDG